MLSICSLASAPIQGSVGIAFHAELMLSFGTDNEICAGLGIANCNKVGDVSADLGPTIDLAVKFTKSSSDSTGVTIGFDYSYSTTSNPYIPGKLGDMFLTPSLNVKFSKSALISFNPTTCAGSSREIITWSLDSPSNVPV